MRVERAARNNAFWCDTVCRAHGTAGEFFDTVWRNPRPSPPHYPNLVTLRDTHDRAEALDHVRHLVALPLAGAWGVKDSFRTLDLAALGFDMLFEASWIWCEPTHRRPKTPAPGIQWSQVASSAELAGWEAAWSVGAVQNEQAGRPCQFPPSLLADRNVIFLAGHKGPELIAGGILNHSDGVVGLSNVFASATSEISVWEGLAHSADLAFLGLPLVGYEHGDFLDVARACGLELAGNLRVWLHRMDASLQD